MLPSRFSPTRKFPAPLLTFAALVLFAALSCGGARAQTVVLPPAPAATGLAPTATPVPVAPLIPAGVIPASIALTVTGSPADQQFLDGLIRDALDRAIRPTLKPGASIRYGPIVPWPLPSLETGSRAAVNVQILITSGVDSTWVTGTTTVNLTDVTVAHVEPSLLFLSDDPEYLQSEGLVFRGRVDSAHAARLYFYHDDIGLPRDLDVVLTAQVPTRVHVVAAQAGPDLDVMSVGHTVSRNFLLFSQQDEGTVLDIPAGVPLVVSHDLILQGELVAGAIDFNVLSGGPVNVSVVASPAGARPEQFLNGPHLWPDGHNRHGTFSLDGFGTSSADYTVGGPDVAIRYGGTNPTPPNVDPSDRGRDLGDYGVVHKFTFKMNNPTDVPSPVYLYEKPLGGPVRSTFIVDGQLKEVGCARLSQPYWFMTYQVPPHSIGASTTLTMTDGGSYYPLELGASGTPPNFNTPPPGSADGCSPNVPPAPAPVPSAIQSQNAGLPPRRNRMR